jgi:prepilin-type processing-associated H-X9-DG protein
MSSIKLAAQKVKDQSNLKTIVAAWKEYTINRGNTMNLMQASPGGYWSDYGMWFAASLAGCVQNPDKLYPSKSVLNDPYVYISSGDKYASKVFKEYIIMGVNTGEGAAIRSGVSWSTIANADFSLANRTTDYLSSYCTIANLDGSVPLATTPLTFTRGLKSDGKWDEKYGLYGSKGGYVAFCDGHVTWFDGSKPAKFLHWNGEQYTTDIRQTVPNVAKFGCGGIKSTSTKLPNVVVWGNGTGGN